MFSSFHHTMMTESGRRGPALNGLARRLFASVFVSLMAAALLSLLPALGEKAGEGEGVPAFGPTKQKVLTEETLADFLSGQPEGLRVIHADLERGDLRLRLKRAGGPRESVYQGTLHMIRGALVHTSNVESVTLSVLGADQPLLTVYATRSDLAADPEMKRMKELTAKEYLRQMFRLKGPWGE